MVQRLFAGWLLLLIVSQSAYGQTWTPLTHQPAFSPSTSLLLTDGTVMVQASQTGTWWRLTPDNVGSYVNGTWSQIAPMPAGYGPLYYASAVLPDGRVIVMGGEYNYPGSSPSALGTAPPPRSHLNQPPCSGQCETALGAIYDPASNSWTTVPPPVSWFSIGDASSVVLADGTFMLGNCCNSQQALLNASTLTWTITGANKADSNSEESWTLLPNGEVLTADVWNGTNSESYVPSSGSWSSRGSTIVPLANSCAEIGPAVLRPDSTVFATGATNNTAIYNTSFRSWAAGPAFPGGLGSVDGPAALLPSGSVLVDVGPSSPCYASGTQFFEFNGSAFVSVPAPPNATGNPTYVGRMLVLPTGQIFFTDGITAQIYTSSGTYQSAWQPTLTLYSATVTPGTKNYLISGTQFNGLSQGAQYGDDAQMATNYPLVRITNYATGHVFYAKTHNHSTMAVATGNVVVSTQFDAPAGMELGASSLVVVANGIPSAPVSINLTPDMTIAKSHTGNFSQGQTGATYTLTVSNGGSAWTSGKVWVTDSLPTGLTASAISGTGWSCTTSPLACSRSDGLANGSSYPAITLTVSVTTNAPASVTNTAIVSGGGDVTPNNNSASDPTTITPKPNLIIAKSHSGNFGQGQTGAIYTLTVSNVGSAATSGTVYVNDILPAGMSATALSGVGWTCTLSSITCSRTDTLAAGSAYSPITVTVYVFPNAPSSVTNTASVSGGGDITPADDAAADPTTIGPLVLSSSADVAVWLDAGAMTAYAGDVSTSTFTNVRMTVSIQFQSEGLIFTVPAGCTLIPPRGGQFGSTATYTCTTSTLAPGSTVSFPFTCSGSSYVQGVMTASLVTPTTPPDTNSQNNAMSSFVSCSGGGV